MVLRDNFGGAWRRVGKQGFLTASHAQEQRIGAPTLQEPLDCLEGRPARDDGGRCQQNQPNVDEKTPLVDIEQSKPALPWPDDLVTIQPTSA